MTDRARILIVDDTPSIIKTLNGILQNEYKVSVATSGQDCLEFVLGKVAPDLILLDIMMPEMDGYEVCRRLKQNTKTRDIPVVFVTGMSEIEDETLGLKIGAVDYITKPVSPPIVLARIKNHLLLKNQHDQLKESISIMEYDAEILRQKAELGIQAGGLAHDINNILAGCVAVEIIPELLPEDLPEKKTVQEYVDMIMETIRLGAEICQGYTSYLQNIGSKAEVQPVLPLLQPIDMYSRQFKGEIRKDFAEDLPSILCKGYQIKRVLVNLFVNACQAIDGQDEQIINVRVWSEDGRIYLSMQDNGSGIPADVLPDIFNERFSTKETGTGLGLFMVKEIVDSHHGTIKVGTEEGIGTTFTLSFPTVGEQTPNN